MKRANERQARTVKQGLWGVINAHFPLKDSNKLIKNFSTPQPEPLRAHQEEQLPGLQLKSHPALLQLHREVLTLAVPREHHSLWLEAGKCCHLSLFRHTSEFNKLLAQIADEKNLKFIFFLQTGECAAETAGQQLNQSHRFRELVLLTPQGVHVHPITLLSVTWSHPRSLVWNTNRHVESRWVWRTSIEAFNKHLFVLRAFRERENPTEKRLTFEDPPQTMKSNLRIQMESEAKTSFLKFSEGWAPLATIVRWKFSGKKTH